MISRKSITLLFASAAAVSALVLGIGGTASATTAPVATAAATQHTSLTPAAAKAILERDLANHTVATPTAVPAGVAQPDFSCAYLYVCGQGANGNSFAYTACNRAYTLPDLLGNGPLINNQIPGTVSYFYDASGNFLFSSTAYDYEPSIDWTPVQYAIAC
ncbi:MAG TPA: hypothetical protein VGN81_02630 [Pseudonocardiaceae bacterium]|jgi:hypothetical protein